MANQTTYRPVNTTTPRSDDLYRAEAREGTRTLLIVALVAVVAILAAYGLYEYRQTQTAAPVSQTTVLQEAAPAAAPTAVDNNNAVDDTTATDDNAAE